MTGTVQGVRFTVQSLTDIRSLLAARGLAPRKNFGQNFLIDQNLIRKLVDAAGVGTDGASSGGSTAGAPDLVLEIGPGTGTLTDELLGRGCAVIASEIDHGLCDLLRDRYANQPRFRLVEGDCLAGKRSLSPGILDLIAGRAFTLVSNLPYSAGTPVIVNLLAGFFSTSAANDKSRTPPRTVCRGVHVTIQREVADRLTATPGAKDYGPLAILCHAVAEVRHIASLPPECFWPRPDVHSSMVSITPRTDQLTSDPGRLFEFASRLFEQRRKQLGAILGRQRSWPEGVSPTSRAEQLSAQQILGLITEN